MTIGDYLARLAALHNAIRARADAGDLQLEIELEALDLETVSG